ncbi:uncharacterized protein LOC110678739 [Aedes aegypti]|uniref:Chitin-binding type-2 domain-containing protein n=1 Tax=Aedes aegypti TaxID=7159 RepID=A0A6I8THM3_AEDAE|nr:uncharacterized protein LOC110678739 [Aedes aegypti]
MILFLLPILGLASATNVFKDPRCIQYSAGAQAMTLPHRTDCTKFYICDAEGNALEMRCPGKLYYSAEEGVCSFDSSACTGGEININEEPKEVPSDNEQPIIIDNGFKNEQEFLQMACLDQPSGVTFPLADDCFSYVVCLQRKPIILTCPDGLAYDNRNSKCEFKEVANCKSHHVPMPLKPVDVSETFPERTPIEGLDNGQSAWNVPDLPLHKPAPEAPIISIPMEPERPAEPILPMPQLPIVPLPEEPIPVPQNPIPDPVIPREQEFMPYGPVTYGDSRCPQRFDPNHPVLLPHSRDCTKYYVCVGTNAVEKQCPNGQHWSLQNSWCDFPQRAKCIAM